ncbi:MAG TPA: CopG family transcriptional regulator [Planctomycetota bacterium]|nr:CopG family transcriptional regulator [Planctomycetota bacterium]
MRPKSRSSGKTTIKLPTPLYEKLSALIDGAGYNSVTDFVVYVLRDLVGQCAAGAKRPTEHEIDETRQRLRNLGYL